MSDVRPNTAELIEHLAVDSAGAAVTGATGLRTSVRRVSDGFFYDWSDSTFKTPASVVSLYQALTAVSATYAPGHYSASWPGGATGVYVAEVTQSPAGTVVNIPATAELRVGQLAGAVELAAVQTDVDDLQVSVAALPTDASIASTLASAHGAGSWATATGFSTHSAADVWAVVTRTLTAIGGSGIASQASVDAIPEAPSAASIVAALLAEPSPETPIAGSLGETFEAQRGLALYRLDSDLVGGGRLILYRRDGTTPWLTWTLRDGSGNNITNVAGSPARRGAAT